MIKWLKKLLVPKESIAYGGFVVRDILKLKLTPVTIEILDSKYVLPVKAEVEKFLFSDGSNLRDYTDESYDCDDFANTVWFRAKQRNRLWAFGLAIIEENKKKHALNWFVDDKHEVWFIEPQTDEIKKPYGKVTLIIG